MTEVAVLAGRSLKRHFRTPPLLFTSFAFPVLLMLTILPIYGGLVGDGYIQQFAPLIVLSTATFGMAPSAVAFHVDFQSGIFNRLRTMPVSAPATILGRVLGDVLRIVAVAAFAVVIAHLVGFRFGTGVLPVLGFFALVAAFGAMCTTVSLLAALSGSSAETVQSSLGPPTTLAFFLSSGFVPVESYPGWIQPIVRANPLSTAGTALTGLASGGPVLVPVLQTLAWVAGIGLLCGWLAARRYRDAGR